ncbi:copia protein [Tanacetum coccineum]
MANPSSSNQNRNNNSNQNQNPNQNQNLNQNLLNANMINDPLYVASSDHPGMVLTNTPFNGSNFHGYSRNVRMALGAKLKLGFIDGSCVKPDVGDIKLFQGRMVANVTAGFDDHFSGDTPFDLNIENEIEMHQGCGFDQKLVVVVSKEVMKMFNGEGGESNASRDYASTSHAGDCILTATYLIKKMLVKLLDWKSPYEKLYGKPPTYDHFGIIGCLCYDANVKPHKDKFKNRGVNMFFPFKQPDSPSNEHSCPTQPVFETHPLEETVILNTPLPKTTPTVNLVFTEPIVEHVAEPDHSDQMPFTSASVPVKKSTRTNVFAVPEPTSYKQAIQHEGWVKAMEAELAALERNETWTITSLLACHKPITSKWVFKTKYQPNGIMERLKARVLIALATAKQCPLHQLDINNAFLHGYIDDKISFKSIGYVQSKHDYSLFVKTQGEAFTVVLVYLDDMLITGNSQSAILSLKSCLDEKFTIKDLGLAKYFLGIELCKTDTRMHLNQRKYILDLLTDAGLTGAKPLTFPLLTQLKLSLDKGTPLKMLVFIEDCFLLKDLHIQVKLPVTLFCDNKSAQRIAVDPCFHDRTKHLDIDCHFTRDKIQEGFLQTAFIPTHLQLADVMTKALGEVQHTFLVDKLRLTEAPT